MTNVLEGNSFLLGDLGVDVGTDLEPLLNPSMADTARIACSPYAKRDRLDKITDGTTLDIIRDSIYSLVSFTNGLPQSGKEIPILVLAKLRQLVKANVLELG